MARAQFHYRTRELMVDYRLLLPGVSYLPSFRLGGVTGVNHIITVFVSVIQHYYITIVEGF